MMAPFSTVMLKWPARSTSLTLALAVTIGLGTACTREAGFWASPNAPTFPTQTRIITVSGSLAFGNVVLGTTVERPIIVRNSGTDVLTLLAMTVPIGISLASELVVPLGNEKVAPGASVTLTFRFVPLTVGPVAGDVTIEADHTTGVNTLPLSANVIAR